MHYAFLKDFILSFSSCLFCYLLLLIFIMLSVSHRHINSMDVYQIFYHYCNNSIQLKRSRHVFGRHIPMCVDI